MHLKVIVVLNAKNKGKENRTHSLPCSHQMQRERCDGLLVSKIIWVYLERGRYGHSNEKTQVLVT